MRLLVVLNPARDRVVGHRVALADRWWLRVRGLLGRPPLGNGDGMLLAPSGAIHTWGMTYPIDVAVLDSGGRVIATYPALPPRRHTPRNRAARYVLELPEGALEASHTRAGDHLVWKPKPEEGT